MRVLIAGGLGFLGTALFAAQGFAKIGLSVLAPKPGTL